MENLREPFGTERPKPSARHPLRIFPAQSMCSLVPDDDRPFDPFESGPIFESHRFGFLLKAPTTGRRSSSVRHDLRRVGCFLRRSSSVILRRSARFATTPSDRLCTPPVVFVAISVPMVGWRESGAASFQNTFRGESVSNTGTRSARIFSRYQLEPRFTPAGNG